MKRILAFLLACMTVLALSVGVTGCKKDSGKTPAGKTDAADAAQDRPVTGVGTAWAVAAALCAAAGGTLAFVLRRKKLRA